ncbi:MAG: hypothetical protein AAF968_13445 [Pseudomonadota bacterium]
MTETRDRTVIGLDVAWQAPVAQWNPQEQSTLTALQHKLHRVAPQLEWEGGATDVGDPWIVAIDPVTDEMVLHIARIGRTYAALDQNFAPLASGHGLRTVIDACLQSWRPLLATNDAPRAQRLQKTALPSPVLDGAPMPGAAADLDETASDAERGDASPEAALPVIGFAPPSPIESAEDAPQLEPERPALAARTVLPEEADIPEDRGERVVREDDTAPTPAAPAPTPHASEATGEASVDERREIAATITEAAPEQATLRVLEETDHAAATVTRTEPMDGPLPDNVIRIDFTISKPKGEDTSSGGDHDGSFIITFDPGPAGPTLPLDGEYTASGLPVQGIEDALRAALNDQFDFVENAGVEITFEPADVLDLSDWAFGENLSQTAPITVDNVFEVTLDETDLFLFA